MFNGSINSYIYIYVHSIRSLSRWSKYVNINVPYPLSSSFRCLSLSNASIKLPPVDLRNTHGTSWLPSSSPLRSGGRPQGSAWKVFEAWRAQQALKSVEATWDDVGATGPAGTGGGRVAWMEGGGLGGGGRVNNGRPAELGSYEALFGSLCWSAR